MLTSGMENYDLYAGGNDVQVSKHSFNAEYGVNLGMQWSSLL